MTVRGRALRPVALLGSAALVVSAAGLGAALTHPASASAPSTPTIVQSYVARTGEVCRLDIAPRIHGADLSGRNAVRADLASIDLRTLDIDRHLPRRAGVGLDDELAAVTAALRLHADGILRGRGPSASGVVLIVDSECRSYARADEPGFAPRDPRQLEGPLSPWGERPADGGGFFHASTGEVCEVQWWVWMDSRFTDDGSVDAARAHLAAVDPALVEPVEPPWLSSESAAMNDGDFEAYVRSHTVISGMLDALADSSPIALGLQWRFQTECV